MKTLRLFMILAGLVLNIAVVAQEMPAGQKNLMQMEGKWVCKNAVINMGGKDYTGEFSVECVAINNNTGIRAQEKFTNEEIGTMRAQDLFGYDPNLQQVHMYTIDNMGTTHDHVGYWIDDHHLYLQYQGVLEGKMYVEQLDMLIKDANTMHFKLTAMLNGEIFQKAELTFVK